MKKITNCWQNAYNADDVNKYFSNGAILMRGIIPAILTVIVLLLFFRG